MRRALFAIFTLLLSGCMGCDDYFIGNVRLVRSEGSRLPGASAPPPAAKKPAAPDTDAEKQRQSVAEIRNLGTALFSWLTDEVGAAAAGKAESVDLNAYPEITMADLEKLLVPDYLPAVPKTDGWGHPLEVRVNVKNVLAEKVMSIRSPGRDGKLSGDVYTVEGFNPADYDQDIVWADGYFLRWPERKNG